MSGRLARLPFAPLEAEVRGGEPVTVAIVAARLGVSRRQVHRFRTEGVTVNQADRLAMVVGSHPFAVWGADWERAPLRRHRAPRPPRHETVTVSSSGAVGLRLVDVGALVEYLGGSFTESQIRDRVYRRTIPHVKLGKSLRFDLDRIDAWVDEHRIEPVQSR